MKYYCECISVPLAEKLKEKGMPYIDIDCDTYNSGTEYQRDEVWCNNTYAETFDWLMSRDIRIHLLYVPKSDLQDEVWRGIVGLDIFEGTWHKAAEAAIEKALTLI